MKKSTQVALSLLVPAMTAYGCSNQPKTVQVPANAAISNRQDSMTIQMNCSCGHSFTISSDRLGKTVQCPNCNRTLNVPAAGTQVTQYYRPYRSNSWLSGWFRGSSSPHPIEPRTHPTETSHATNASHVSFGGFGGTGAHISGGS